VFVNLVSEAYRLKSVEELVMTEERQRAEGRRLSWKKKTTSAIRDKSTIVKSPKFIYGDS